MRNIKIIIEYDGSRYNGWQRLGDTDNTIQGKIENVLSEMLNQRMEIIGSGRTDKGVHARNQAANFKTKSKLSCSEIQAYMNKYLPSDIVVKSATEEDINFHSRYNVSEKKYSYYIWNNPIPTVFNRKYSYHISESLDLDKVIAASKLFLGTHDFKGFSSIKKTKKSTVRTIKSIDIRRVDSMIIFDFVADGFLYNMVRIVMGSLLAVGLGEKELSHIESVFESKTRADAGKTVPAQALFLEDVSYEK